MNWMSRNVHPIYFSKLPKRNIMKNLYLSIKIVKRVSNIMINRENDSKSSKKRIF